MGSATNSCEVEEPHAAFARQRSVHRARDARRHLALRRQQDRPEVLARGALRTGIRNGEGFDFDAAGRLFVTQHGRDQLHENWPELYTAEQGFELPAEEVVTLKQGA